MKSPPCRTCLLPDRLPPPRPTLTVSTSTTQAGAPADVTINATFASSPSSVEAEPAARPGRQPERRAASARWPRSAGSAARSRPRSAPASVNGLPLGQIFNLEPEPGEPARLGIAIIGLIKNEASISLRPDGGLDSTIAELQTGGLPVSSMGLTLDSDFMTLPTSCAPATVTLNGESATLHPDRLRPRAVQPDGRGRARDHPARRARAAPRSRSSSRRATRTCAAPTSCCPSARRSRRASRTGSRPARRRSSTPPAARPRRRSAPSASSRRCSATLGGKVFFGENFRLYVVVDGSGVLVKLAGDVRLDPATGQITTVFDNLPQVPFTTFALSFQGGPRAVLSNPTTLRREGADRGRSRRGAGPRRRPRPRRFTIDQGCTAAAFAPALRVAADSTAAGRPAGAVTMEITRPDGAPDISPRHHRAPARPGRQPEGRPGLRRGAGRRGHVPGGHPRRPVSALAGAGAAPVRAGRHGVAHRPGRRRPRRPGDRASGPRRPGRPRHRDRAREHRAAPRRRPVRPHAPLPALVGGVPVSIRQLAFTFDRPGFILNSSSCAPQTGAPRCSRAPTARTATVTAPVSGHRLRRPAVRTAPGGHDRRPRQDRATARIRAAAAP